MIVQCAACQARFKIADDKVTDHGVKVRCRKCATVFVVRKESAPAPDGAPLGMAAQPSRPAPSLPPAPAPDAAFRRFQTNELAGSAPSGRPPTASAADPFAAMSFPAPATSQPQRPQADPFASLDLTPRKATAPPARPDPFAGIDLSPPPRTPTAPPAASEADPFANIDIGALPGPGSAPPEAPATSDPFAGLEVGAPPSPPPARAPAPAHQDDPFASLDLGGPPKPARAAAAAFEDIFAADKPAAQPSRPPAPSADPFAGIDLGAPAAPPAAVTTGTGSAVPGMPAMPDMLDLGSVDLSAPEPSLNMGDDLEAEASPGIGIPSVVEEPKTIVKSVHWAGGDADKPEVKSMASAYAAQLLTKKGEAKPRRSLVVSALATLVFLAVGGVVLERTARAIRSAQGNVHGPTRELAAAELSSRYYPTREGRPLFVVGGKVQNHAAASQGPGVKVTVEIRRGSSVERTAEAFTGSLPGPEDLFVLSGPIELAELTQRLNSQAKPLEQGASGDFLAVFGEFPEDLADLTLHAVAAASPLPVAPVARPEPRKAEAKRPEPARPEPAKAEAKRPEPAKPEPAKVEAKKPEPAKVEAKKPEPAKVEAKKPEPAKAEPKAPSKKFEFPMDDPQRPLRIKSGEPPKKP